MDIRYKIRQKMDEYGYSFVDLAKASGVPKSALQRYVSGGTEKIPIDRVEKIAKALHVKTEHLIGWADEPSENSLDEQLKGIIYACAGGDKPLSDEQKQDIIDTYRFVQSKKKKE